MFAHTQQHLIGLVRHHRVPGVVYSFFNNRQVILQGQAGQREVGISATAFKATDYFDLASLTKVLGTVNVFLAAQAQQHVTLTTSLKQFWPQFPAQLTVRQLVTHTSGIEGYIPHRNQLNADELKEAILQLPVTSDCNQSLVYRDTNFLILGWLLEKIGQDSIQHQIQTTIFEPVVGSQLTFTPPVAQSVPTAQQKNGTFLRGTVHDPKAQILGSHCGSAGAFGTLAGLVTFCQRVYLTAGSVSWLKQPQVLENDFTLHHLGRSIGWDLRRKWDESGYVLVHTGYTGTLIVLDLKQHQGLVMCASRVHPQGPNLPFLAYREGIIASYLQDLANNPF